VCASSATTSALVAHSWPTVSADCADGAEVLGEDQVRLELFEQIAVDRVERAAVGDCLTHGLLDLEAGEPVRVDARRGHDGKLAHARRPVALLGDGNERVGEAERGDDLGRAR